MKKLLFIFLFVPILSFSQSFEIGLIGGFSKNTMKGLEDYRETQSNDFNYSSITLPIGGLLLQYNFTKRISIKSKLLYHKKGEQLKDIQFTDEQGQYIGNFNSKYIYDYYTLPILIQYNLRGKYLSMFYNFGGYLGYLNRTKMCFDPVIELQYGSLPSEGIDITDNYEKLDVGITFGIGLSYNLNERLMMQIESTLDYGLKEVRKLSDASSEIIGYQPLSLIDKFRTFSIPITFGLLYKI